MEAFLFKRRRFFCLGKGDKIIIYNMEIEIKAKVNDFKPIKNKLKKLGAKKVGLKHQIDSYYLPNARKFSRAGRRVLRTRYDKLSGKVRLESHFYFNQTTGLEHEVEMADIKTLEKILADLKCKKMAVVEKKRESYHYQNMEIVLDEVKGLGKFMEVEIMGEDSTKNKRKIKDFYKKLGMSSKQFVLGPRYHGMILKRKGYKHHYFK